jgi:hypothetical protein
LLKRWNFKKLGCEISGFIMYSIGCMHIYVTTAMSIEIYLVLKDPNLMKKMKMKNYLIIILLCMILSLAWATFPLFGWSYYSLEGSLTSCSVEWADRSWNVMSYNITIWLFGYIIPLSVIIYCNIKTLRIVISFLIR